MVYKKPSSKKTQSSKAPLTANFAPPPSRTDKKLGIGVVSEDEEDAQLKIKPDDCELDEDETDKEEK